MDFKMKSATGLLGRDDGEQVEHLSLQSLIPFQNHPFQVLDNKDMGELVESISAQGVATPIIVRPKSRGEYEIISGHRRVHACTLLERSTIPAFIRDLDDEEAVLFMVDTNIQRQALLFSEKAFAYRMKSEALKRKSGRPKKNEVPLEPDSQNGVPLEPKLKTRELLAKNTGESSAQIQRFIRLTYLSPDLLQLVDRKKLPFQTGVELSYLSEEEQQWVRQTMLEQLTTPTLEQARVLKGQTGLLQVEDVEEILKKEAKPSKPFTINSNVGRFFPPETSQEEMEKTILKLLEAWKLEN